MPNRSRPLRMPANVLVVLGLAALLRVAVFLAAMGSPERFWSPDDREYIPIANHLHASYLTGSGHFFDLGLRRPPLYPIFLRLVFDIFGQNYAAVVIIQLGLSVATVALAYWLACLLLPRRLALLAAFLLAVDPASIVFANQMMTETLFAFLLTLALVLAVVAMRRGNTILAAAAGLLLGLAVLTRPVAFYLPLVLVPALVLAWRRRASVILAAALVVGFAIPAGGWLVRNQHTTGVATISTIEGYNVWHYRAVGALEETGEKPWDARAIAEAQLAPHVHVGDNAAQISRAQLRAGLDILAAHPVDAVKSWGRGEFRLLLGPARVETATLLTGRPLARPQWLHAVLVVDGLITVLTLLAAAASLIGLLARRIAIPELWILAVVAIYLVAVSGGPEAYSRFRVPVAPLFAVLAAGILTWRRASSDQAMRAA